MKIRSFSIMCFLMLWLSVLQISGAINSGRLRFSLPTGISAIILLIMHSAETGLQVIGICQRGQHPLQGAALIAVSLGVLEEVSPEVAEEVGE